MATVDDLCARLRAHGHRVTSQRRAIIRVLLEDDGEHLAADQVFTRVRGLMPDTSHATVYNTLNELVRMGILVELDLGLGERYYDINTTDHAHMVCLRCGRIEDVPYDHEALKLPPKHAHRFQVVDRRVIFRGYCSACISTRGSQHRAP